MAGCANGRASGCAEQTPGSALLSASAVGCLFFCHLSSSLFPSLGPQSPLLTNCRPNFAIPSRSCTSLPILCSLNFPTLVPMTMMVMIMSLTMSMDNDSHSCSPGGRKRENLTQRSSHETIISRVPVSLSLSVSPNEYKTHPKYRKSPVLVLFPIPWRERQRKHRKRISRSIGEA